MRTMGITHRFLVYPLAIALVFAAGFFYAPLITVAWILLLIFTSLLIADIIILLLVREPFSVQRKCEKVLSLSDDNTITLHIENLTLLGFRLEVIDELPVQLQRRDLKFNIFLKRRRKRNLTYEVRPTQRGEYHFGRVLVYCSSILGLAERRFNYNLEQMVPVYPSLIQMRKYSLSTLQRLARYYGLKKMRKIGHSYEFETIKNYITGDDYRAINWRATSRQNQLMVNIYEDEKSQNVYSVLDKSRSMMLPFHGLSLMDYAVNASLVLSNNALHKHDKAGLITFSDKTGTVIKADNTRQQLNKIVEALYKEQERHTEANFEMLYQLVNRVVKVRSLLFLFTNIESAFMAERVIGIMRQLNHRHLLVVVLFENTEIDEYIRTPAENLQEIYYKTVARKMAAEKQQIARLLSRHRIQVILTKPEELTVNSVNKYLELKARGLI